MRSEREQNHSEYARLLTSTLFLSTLALWISDAAFTSGVRKEIVRRADGRCERCNQKVPLNQRVAGHLDHARGDHYNSPDNGRLHCWACEMEYHFIHHSAPWKIGMREDDNLSVIRSWFHLLDGAQKRRMLKKYGWSLRNLVQPPRKSRLRYYYNSLWHRGGSGNTPRKAKSSR